MASLSRVKGEGMMVAFQDMTKIVFYAKLFTIPIESIWIAGQVSKQRCMQWKEVK